MENDVQEEDGPGTAKRMKTNFDDKLDLGLIEIVTEPPQVGPGLLELSDDVLLIIFAHLSPADLINLSQSCSRLWNVTRDRTLWSHVDCRADPLDSKSFEDVYCDYLLPTTRYLALDFRLEAHRGRRGGGKKGRKARADARTQGRLTFTLLRRVSVVCHRLDTLILQDVCFDAQQIPFGQFPSSLTHLSLKNSDVQNLPVRVSYFNDMHRIMPNLQVLILSHSLWLESHSLMAISKCAKLRELRLQGCYALGDCIAYFSIATRFGFKDLETLDLRGTQVGDPEVSCLNLVPSLRHLYLESITQYARRRDAERYMNRVRQYPDITIVPHPDSSPAVQNPVILLQRIDGEMVARNVTSEFHSLGGGGGGEVRPPAAPATPGPSAFMRRLRERWHVPDGRAGTGGRPVIVVPVKRPQGPRATGFRPPSPPSEQYNALEDALRLRGVITLIHDNIFASRSNNSNNNNNNLDRPGSSGVSFRGPSRDERSEPGPSCSSREKPPDEEDAATERGGEEPDEEGSRPREVKVEEGRVVVHINNAEVDAAPSVQGAAMNGGGGGGRERRRPRRPREGEAGNPLMDYREYLTRYIREDGGRTKRGEDEENEDGRRGRERREEQSGEGRGNSSKADGFAIDNGPCCSYLPEGGRDQDETSLPGCSRYAGPESGPSCSRKRRLPPPGDGDRSSGGDESDSGASEDGDRPRPPAPGSPLHFCTIGRARFSGLTVPFFHRVPQVTDSCVHVVCGGGKSLGPRPPQLLTLRGPGEPAPVHPCRLKTLVLRHFPKITDQSLYVLSKLVSLRYLDVTGTSVTACGVKNFRLMRPDVEVSSDHDVPIEP